MLISEFLNVHVVVAGFVGTSFAAEHIETVVLTADLQL